MATEEYSIGYEEGHQAGWNAAMDSLPAQRTWVGLTDEQIDDLSRTMVKGSKSANWLCRAIEAAHGIKEKNNG